MTTIPDALPEAEVMAQACVFILGIIVCVSGSPRRTLYSITKGSSATLMSPKNIKPEYGIFSAFNPNNVGSIILFITFCISILSTNETYASRIACSISRHFKKKDDK